MKKMCCLGNFGDHRKKRSQRLVSILESKKLRDILAGPRFRMVKKIRRAANNETNNIASDTRGERWATISRNHVWDGEAFVQAQKILTCSKGAKNNRRINNALVYFVAKSTYVIMRTFLL